jgi:hypothetical protein
MEECHMIVCGKILALWDFLGWNPRFGEGERAAARAPTPKLGHLPEFPKELKILNHADNAVK